MFPPNIYNSHLPLQRNVCFRRHLYTMKVNCYAVAARIRNPGYRPTYSYGLARPISANSLMQAWLIHGCRPGLS